MAAAMPAAARVDIVSIQGALDFPSLSEGLPEGSQTFYRLRGQSAYISTRTNSGSTGGQLDSITSFSSADSFFEISFVEAFPEEILTDYLSFGYFGVIETVITSPGQDEQIVDTSLVIAGAYPFVLEGLRIDEILPVASESELVPALTNSFDSPEFFSILDSHALHSNPDLLGDIGLGFVDLSQSNTVQSVRDAGILTLYAFKGGDKGDQAVNVGYLTTGITRVVPAPASAAILALSGLAAARRRRTA
jgi:hypothetical protein